MKHQNKLDTLDHTQTHIHNEKVINAIQKTAEDSRFLYSGSDMFTPRGPTQPLWAPTSMPYSNEMAIWMQQLPPRAFSMTGPLGTVRRHVLHTDAPTGTDLTEEELLRTYPSVTYEALTESWAGWQGVIVAFHRPANAGRDNETVYVGIGLSQWRDPNSYRMETLPAAYWRQLILHWMSNPGVGMLMSG